MKYRTLGSLFLTGMFAAAMVGCDETVSEKKTTEVKPNGTTTEQKETVKKEADGDVKVEKKTEVDKPGTANDESTKVKVETEKN